jgi:YbgC/YbaW family acyl-CoA thioester hydrolase
MFSYRKKVSLKETDATGVLYFSEQFAYAMEAFEGYLSSKGFSLKQLLDSPLLMPVVHAEADYLAPLHAGDEVVIKMGVETVGQSSVTLIYQIFCPVRLMDIGRVKIVHVAVDRITQQSVPIPEWMRALLS